MTVQSKFLAAGLILLGTASVPPGLARETPGPNPRAAYQSLLGNYSDATRGIRTATTAAERKAVVTRLATYPGKFIALAETHANDAVSLDALQQAIQALGTTDSAALTAWEYHPTDFPDGCQDDSPSKIVAILERNHLESARLGPLLDRMRYGYRLEFQPFLEKALEKNPHRRVRGIACLSLAQFLNDRRRMARLSEDRPELAPCFDRIFGPAYLPGLKRRNTPAVGKTIEVLLERAATEYAAVEIRPGQAAVGERAERELYGLRQLGLGKRAPVTRGRDQAGTPFALSNYLGKVVLLYFWNEY